MGTEVYDNLRHSCRKVWELVGGSGKLKSDGGKGYFSLKVSFNYHKGGGVVFDGMGCMGQGQYHLFRRMVLGKGQVSQ